jgi:5-hydroxyisourate hydrolase
VSSAITTHVLDTSRGTPAAAVRVAVEREAYGAWKRVAQAETDASGRCATLLPRGSLEAGAYRLTFDVGSYFQESGRKTLWRMVTIEFVVEDRTAHYHVPLLISPYGYSTYRGS